MKKRFSRWLALAAGLAFGVAGTALGQAIPAGSITFNRYDFSTGQPVAQLWQMNADGSGARRVPTNLVEPFLPTWSADGQALAVSAKSPQRPNLVTINAFVLNPLTGQASQITQYQDIVDTENGSTYVFCLYKAWSRDRRRIAIAGYVNSINSSGGSTLPVLNVYDLEGKVVADVALGGIGELALHSGEGLDWSPTQDVLAWEHPYTTQNGFPANALFLMTPTPGATQRQLTFPGVFILQGGGGIVTAEDYQPAFSPDGSQVAFVRAYVANTPFTQPNVSSLRIVNANGTNDREIVQFRQGLYVSKVRWTPDGRSLVFDLGNQTIDRSDPTIPGGAPVNLMDPATSGIYQVAATPGATPQPLFGPGAAFPSPNPRGLSNAPKPRVTRISPTKRKARSAGFTLTVAGNGFTAGSVIRWGATPVPTAMVSSTQLTGAIAQTLLARKGTVKVTVQTPPPGGGTSNAKAFKVTR